MYMWHASEMPMARPNLWSRQETSVVDILKPGSCLVYFCTENS